MIGPWGEPVKRTLYLIRSKYEEHAWNISFRFDEKAEHVEQSP